MADLLPQIVPGNALQTGSPCHGVSRMSAPLSARNRASLPQPDLDGLVHLLRSIHRSNTADLVEADSGVPSGTVRNWLDGRTGVSLPHFLALYIAYGPRVLVALWPGRPPACLDAQIVAQEEAELLALATQLATKKRALADRRNADQT